MARDEPTQVVNVYATLGPDERVWMHRMEHKLGIIFRQNNQMMELLENQGESPAEKAAYIAMRETLKAGRLELVQAMEEVNKTT